MTMSILSNYIGVIGVILVLQSYLWLQIGKWQQTELKFSVVNFIGSIFILVSLNYHFNLASFMIEVVWLLISLYGIFKHYSKQPL